MALHQPNSLWFPVTYYGILLAGAVVAPLNPTLPRRLCALSWTRRRSGRP